MLLSYQAANLSSANEMSVHRGCPESGCRIPCAFCASGGSPQSCQSWDFHHTQPVTPSQRVGPSPEPIGNRPIPRYQRTVTLVILSVFRSSPILASPTTEPGRRGWKRRLGSPISAPHFFVLTLTHPDHSPVSLAPHPASNRIKAIESKYKIPYSISPGEA
jgi:hypothetical protein